MGRSGDGKTRTEEEWRKKMGTLLPSVGAAHSVRRTTHTKRATSPTCLSSTARSGLHHAELNNKEIIKHIFVSVLYTAIQ